MCYDPGRKYMQTDRRIFTGGANLFGGSVRLKLVRYWFLKFSGIRSRVRPTCFEIRGLNYERNGL
jgi:hypothetical protein